MPQDSVQHCFLKQFDRKHENFIIFGQLIQKKQNQNQMDHME